MSGFEIAGVVLGAFPILCGTAKNLGTMFKKTKWWWQFETSFENFVSTIATQEIAYIQVLERLLGPLDVTEAEYDSLLRDPKSNLWHESHIQEELRQCLPHSKYTWFMWNLSDLNTAIEELQKLLPIDKTSFSSDKDRLLKRITDVNDDLHQFFDRGATLVRPSATKPTIPFRDMHRRAVTFYECLARRWKCSCLSAHTVGIAAHPAIHKPSRMAEHGYFNVLFEAEASFKQLRLQVETLTTSKYETNSDSVAPEKAEPLDQSTINASTLQSIDSFIKTTTIRQSRLYVGLSLALTLLCLATSSWVPTQLAKDDIFLVCCESGGKPSSSKRFGPYFSRTSQDICSSSSSVESRTWNAKSSLLLLGVVLLELFHGQQLEQQDAWAESLDEEGQPNESTRLCGAFLWICRAKESLKTHFGSELGGELSEAIRKCICFDFGRDDDYGDSRLAEVVYREVVVPLEKCCPSI
ncbi:hypothetical protein CH63R_07633 [Colletotrichum higginsianum IMI 349063]|uniref:DUF7580 domain-containing protein n=1 Tax=Colletotrichum higginsianum (strain IMI 349063) TaxID=759273 RepID=A0A1B7YAG0_COLHI|nr:hypothetical protein CH63R_07633 [Colletotrichum higginsianum IMI 349063]OBR08868.1 hypothetical protein CH63R_07633 [Colletotrichum higginsianum IMI 349063]